MFRLPKSVLHFGAGALALGALVLAAPKTAHAIAATLVQVTNTAANPVPTQEVDAKNAFQTSLNLGLSSQPISIPFGQRLVVDFVTVSGIANSLSGAIQPTIILSSTLNGGSPVNYYLDPAPTPVTIPGANQLHLAQAVKVYADSLTVEPAYAGFTPFTFTFGVAISGHLIPIP